MKLKVVKEFIQNQFTTALAKGPLYLVFHSHNQDVKYASCASNIQI